MTSSFTSVRGDELVACFDAYKQNVDANATKIDANVTSKFLSLSNSTNACDDWDELDQIVKGVLDMKGVTALTPTEVVAAIPAWAKPQLVAGSVSGYVSVEKAAPIFYYDILRVEDENARSREQDPTGIDLTDIRAQWVMVQYGSTLDREYFNPVTFPAGVLDGPDIFKYMRAAFWLRGLSLESTGYSAIDDFASAGEGPDNDPAFAPIKTALRKRSIKKRFYYHGSGTWHGDGWSSNVLIVVDEHGQAWGMQMGYSE